MQSCQRDKAQAYEPARPAGGLLQAIVSRFKAYSGTSARRSCVRHSDLTTAFDAQDGDTVLCMSGSIWVTQGDGHDYILAPGELLRLSPSDRVVVEKFDRNTRYQLRCRNSGEA